MKKSKNAFGNVFRRISTATLNSENELEVESCKDKTRWKEMHVGTQRERKREHPKESWRGTSVRVPEISTHGVVSRVTRPRSRGLLPSLA